MLKAAFIFLAPGADPVKNRSVVDTPSVSLVSIGVENYDVAVSVAKDLVKDGFVAIELCGGFGHLGVARIAEAVEGKAAVGAVRFDIHPGLENKSGDSVF
ncbi:MAG: DUF6506 family protein [Clostridiales bacterium]|nr:DUF6506 family protein [Clostridiales bacterium]